MLASRFLLAAKRGPSSFIVFANEHRERVIEEFGFQKKQIGDIGKKLGEMWQKLSEKEKEVYKAKALAARP